MLQNILINRKNYMLHCHETGITITYFTDTVADVGSAEYHYTYDELAELLRGVPDANK